MRLCWYTNRTQTISASNAGVFIITRHSWGAVSAAHIKERGIAGWYMARPDSSRQANHLWRLAWPTNVLRCAIPRDADEVPMGLDHQTWSSMSHIFWSPVAYTAPRSIWIQVPQRLASGIAKRKALSLQRLDRQASADRHSSEPYIWVIFPLTCQMLGWLVSDQRKRQSERAAKSRLDSSQTLSSIKQLDTFSPVCQTSRTRGWGGTLLET
jgi:hypothetical protein